MSRDRQGRKYATVEEVHEGLQLECDDAFTCISTGRVVTVNKDSVGLFIPCDEGRHYLDGQLDFDGGQFYVGLYPVKVEA